MLISRFLWGILNEKVNWRCLLCIIIISQIALTTSMKYICSNFGLYFFSVELSLFFMEVSNHLYKLGLLAITIPLL